MAPTNAKSLMKDFRASFRRKKVTDTTPKIDKVKQQEEEEQKKLVELKEIMSKDLHPRYQDEQLMGYLRARSLDVSEAEKLITLDMSLRKFLMLDDFVKNYQLTELNKKFGTSGLLGTDKEGSLVRVINIGRSDIKGFVQALSTIDNFRLMLWYLEKDLIRQEAENKKTGKTKHQVSYIINSENLTFSKITYKPALDTAILGLKLFQDHYHDATKAVYLVNVPSFFGTVFKMFKPVIGEALHQKIKVIENNGKEELLKVIDADKLPVCFGGNRTDDNGDPECKGFLGEGGRIPESYFVHNLLSPDDPEVTCATVPAGSFLNFRFDVPAEGSRVSWHIQSKDNDISVGVFLEPPEEAASEEKQEKKKDKNEKKEEDMSKLIQLTPIIRSQCHITPEIGHTYSWFKGTGILHMDNTYSWMSSKEVMFKITIEPPTKKQTK